MGYKKGDRVHVEFDGAVDGNVEDGPVYTTRVRTDHGMVHYIFLEATEDVKRGSPALWPPVPGDVWERADGARYVARTSFALTGGIGFDGVSADGRSVRSVDPEATRKNGELRLIVPAQSRKGEPGRLSLKFADCT